MMAAAVEDVVLGLRGHRRRQLARGAPAMYSDNARLTGEMASDWTFMTAHDMDAKQALCLAAGGGDNRVCGLAPATGGIR
jgi:hypothetical protein